MRLCLYDETVGVENQNQDLGFGHWKSGINCGKSKGHCNGHFCLQKPIWTFCCFPDFWIKNKQTMSKRAKGALGQFLVKSESVKSRLW